MSNKKQKDRTCKNNCKDICGECQVMVFKKQTAVEWLAFELSKIGYLPNGIPDAIYNQAKEMEKEQIENAYKIGKIEANMPKEFKVKGEQYYKETYEQ